jgi:hypothetical protein
MGVIQCSSSFQLKVSRLVEVAFRVWLYLVRVSHFSYICQVLGRIASKIRLFCLLRKQKTLVWQPSPKRRFPGKRAFQTTRHRQRAATGLLRKKLRPLMLLLLAPGATRATYLLPFRRSRAAATPRQYVTRASFKSTFRRRRLRGLWLRGARRAWARPPGWGGKCRLWAFSFLLSFLLPCFLSIRDVKRRLCPFVRPRHSILVRYL